MPLILHVEGPPHLALGDAPHPTCRDTQSSEDLSAYFPQTPNFHSHCMGTTSDLASTKPTRRGQEFQGMFPRRLSTCQIVKKDSIKSHICTRIQILFSKLTFTFSAPANLKWSRSLSECRPAVWGDVSCSWMPSAYFTFPPHTLLHYLA